MKKRILLAAATALSVSAGNVNAAETLKVAIGQKGLWDTMVTVHCIETGICKKNGVEVEITWTRGGAETIQAAITGSVDFAMATGILGAIGAYGKGAPIRIAGAEITGARDIFWYAKADSGIESIKDAGGKTMGFSRPGSSTNLVALALAKAAGVKPELTPTGGISATRTQVMSGQIDIGWSVPPFNLDLIEKGDLRIVATGGEAPDVEGQTIRVNVVNQSVLENRREAADAFMRAYGETVDHMYANLDETIARYAKFNEIEESVARAAVKFYPKDALQPYEIKKLDVSIAQAVEYKRLGAPLSDERKVELVKILGQ